MHVKVSLMTHLGRRDLKSFSFVTVFEQNKKVAVRYKFAKGEALSQNFRLCFATALTKKYFKYLILKIIMLTRQQNGSLSFKEPLIL